MRKSQSKRRKLGQNFLKDARFVHRIVEAAGVGAGDLVVEIGPGRGVLTRALLATGAHVHAVELDEELYDSLRGEMGGAENFTIERGNAMRLDLGFVEDKCHVVSNLPYSVSVAIIKRLLEQLDKISSMILMVQSEVADRLTAEPGGSKYGSLSALVEYHCQTERLFTVPPGAFRPAPKVDSAVIRLTPRKEPSVDVDDSEAFFGFIHSAFQHRRKTIRNNLSGLFETADALDGALDAAGVAPSKRPQEVTLAEYAALYGRWRRRG